jgi:acyl dehydratase
VAGPLPLHRVRAVNTVAESENKIHDDRVAAQYGFRGGLVAGSTVYGYMAAPIAASMPEWLERGSMKLRLIEPFYDGDEVVVRTEVDAEGSIRVGAERPDGTVCAQAAGKIRRDLRTAPAPFAEAPLPAMEQRVAATRGTLVPGAALGTVVLRLDTADPGRLLQLSNDILVRNFRLAPWIHTASEIDNWGVVNPGDEISVRGRIHDRFDRKGHELVVLDVMLIASGGRLVETVRHTAIYRVRAIMNGTEERT